MLLSAEEYHRLKRHDRTALYPWELNEADLRALEVAEPPAAAALHDHEYPFHTLMVLPEPTPASTPPARAWRAP